MEKNMPKGWIETELGKVTTVVTGNTPSKKVPEYYGNTYPWVKPADVNRESILERSEEYLSESGSRKARMLPIGSVMVTCIGNLGNVAISSVKCSTNQQINSIVDYTNKLNPKFIYYQSQLFKPWLTENSTSTTISMVNKSVFSTAPFLIPPRAEQDRIVAKVDALMAQYAAIQQAMERIPPLLKDFRQQVLTQAVTGKLTQEWRDGKELENANIFIAQVLEKRKAQNPKFKIPDEVESVEFPFELPSNWSFAFLQTFGEFTRGKSKHRPRNDERLFGSKYPFIQTGAISNADLIVSADKYLSNFGLAQSRLFPTGTLCITIAANIAETAILDLDCCFPDSVVGYLPYEDLYSSKFAMFYLRTIQKDLEQYAPATAQKNINLGILFKVPFPVPPLREQQEIVRRVESLFEKATAIEQRYEQLKVQIDTLPQSILHKAFKGQLVEQLASDGSAVELLEEIKKLKLNSNLKGEIK
jgi:type I restriction enzyme S subunit